MTYDSIRELQRVRLTGFAKDMVLAALKPIPVPLPILKSTPDTTVWFFSVQANEFVRVGDLCEGDDV